MMTDPYFYAAAVPAVIMVGLSKGGFGGAMALLGVPLMALAISPVQAAAILLPILIVMDIASLWSWRSHKDTRTLSIMVPGALIGIGIGWATAAWVTVAMIRLIVGAVALWFVWRYMVQKLAEARGGDRKAARGHRPAQGVFWGALAGFTSFVSHAGGPPYQIYTLPLRQDPRTYTGTSVRFFAIINALKLVPYFALGQFDTTNLSTSLVLAPLALVATLGGAFIVRRMKPDVFYPFMYVMVFLASLKLIWDGTVHLLA
ncbi:MAG: sulfite exporter TauE/SafE family protein [Hoeflea sp.]|uniref:sulfite exporter TauE/SafE family protein n=1 Tax=Hoeflea sp. TaxID=1940281 RepID=UPI001E110851|nr:sulfite exporter TauE/SafE family protein [Hoeflea sp.]MBU4528257.1 sulfite exporter TauE/SafE family protein [Alphaproteobacteria bacterium]MBU4543853.1 sulfite exporter TauE/SafE family protein [Alphaproteobacteria bacterium]MBU4548494.1 sulfite exporter TauE/SafE family protein [Alphaproteobacteria bacterium]MBV1722573.1 sulfite exporter TauE/SafE family protein [Hoeflea sp.]MBV1762242.1 sulfite exporter TauE/SafE family protein [Hoeflea sp.]